MLIAIPLSIVISIGILTTNAKYVHMLHQLKAEHQRNKPCFQQLLHVRAIAVCSTY